MEVVHYPDPSLRRGGRPVEAFDDELATTARAMLDAMYRQKGVGLAAPQVGLDLQLLVLNPTGEKSADDEELVLINPEIVQKKGAEVGEEGCLSFPGIYADVERHQKIVVVYRDLAGAEQEMRYTDFDARVIQHELDHLKGVLFVDRVSSVDKLRIRNQLLDLERKFAPRTGS